MPIGMVDCILECLWWADRIVPIHVARDYEDRDVVNPRLDYRAVGRGERAHKPQLVDQALVIIDARSRPFVAVAPGEDLQIRGRLRNQVFVVHVWFLDQNEWVCVLLRKDY